MGFPNSTDQAAPASTDSPGLGDDQIRALKLFIEDVLGITDATSYTAGGITYQTNGRLTALTRWSLKEGAAIASAAALTPGTDGNLFHITGTTGITSIASIDGAGPIWLVFDDAVLITHDATALILRGGVNHTTVAGEIFCFMHEGSGNYRELGRSIVRSGTLSSVQIIRKAAQTQVVNNSTTLVNDDTLLAPLAANETVYFILNIYIITNGTADFKAGFTVPTGATLKWTVTSGVYVEPGATVTNQSPSGGASGDTLSFGGFTTSAGITILGSVRNGSTAGNLQLQWAQQTAAVVDTFVQTDSFLLVSRA